jgi:hypothetical protein
MSRLLWMAAVGAVVFGWPVYGQESTRQDFEEFCRAFEGRWVGEVTWVTDWEAFGKRGEKVTAHVDLRISPDGHALTGVFYAGNGSGTSLGYFDAAAKQIKWVWVNSAGGTSVDVMHREGKNWVNTSGGSNADGTKTQSRSMISVSDDGNTHTWKGKGTVGGKPVDDQHDVYRRVSKPAKR